VSTLIKNGTVVTAEGTLAADVLVDGEKIVSVAARLDPGQAGRNIGRIAAVAYSGLLGGPVAIGAIASGVGLRDALLVPAALALVITAAAGVLRPR